MWVRRHRTLAVITGLALMFGLWATVSIAEETASRSHKDPNLARLESRLDEVLANQQTILHRFDDVMEELRIIKVRATLHSS